MGHQLELPTGRTVVVVGCGKSKLAHAAPLRELYTGSLFRARTKYAQQFGGVGYVVSALLHWMPAGTISAPYEMELSKQTPQLRAQWQRVTLEGAMRDTRPGDTVLVLASGEYAGTWADELARLGRTVLRPLAGLTMGRQLAWLAEHTPQRDGGRAEVGGGSALASSHRETRESRAAELARRFPELAAPSHGRFAPRFEAPPSLAEAEDARAILAGEGAAPVEELRGPRLNLADTRAANDARFFARLAALALRASRTSRGYSTEERADARRALRELAEAGHTLDRDPHTAAPFARRFTEAELEELRAKYRARAAKRRKPKAEPKAERKAGRAMPSLLAERFRL